MTRGLPAADVALAMQRLHRLSDMACQRYALPPAEVSASRARFRRTARGRAA